MTLSDQFKNTLPEEVLINSEAKLEDETRYNGKIIKLSEDGWGFISSKEIPFTRIFFHWSSLKQNTLKFTELKSGMKVTFNKIIIPDKGTRAIRIEVLK